MTVSVNAPKTPVTEGSSGIATAAVPNVCKMPGPPAPFVPTPLPNIGKSSMSPKDFSTTVKIEGKAVAIKGSTFGSMGDIAAKGTGGGIISANVEGPTAFVAPGSLDVKIEGKNVQLLGDAMTNNNGSPPNASTPAEMQPPDAPLPPFVSGIDCEKNKKPPSQGGKGWDDCDVKQLCAKVKDTNKLRKDGELEKQPPGRSKHPDYAATKGDYSDVFETASAAKTIISEAWLNKQFYDPCAKEKWEEAGRPARPNEQPAGGGAEMFNPDHCHDCGLGGNLQDITNFKMLSSSVNKSVGGSFGSYDPAKNGDIELPKCYCP
ncbi:MAG: DUF4150 domain-containing protein [Myxococcales bacterium]